MPVTFQAEGRIEGIDFKDNTPGLMVGGTIVKMSDVVQIKQRSEVP